MGYMIEQSLQNRLNREGIDRPAVTLITQVIIDKSDPQIADPSKFIGQFYTDEEADKFAKERGWVLKPDANRGWRRVVLSPQPISIVADRLYGDFLSCFQMLRSLGSGCGRRFCLPSPMPSLGGWHSIPIDNLKTSGYGLDCGLLFF